MKTFSQFSTASEVLFYFPHSIEFKGGGFSLDNMQVVGYQTQSLRLRHTGDTVSNWPYQLVVKKILKSGKLSANMFLCPISDLSREAASIFWTEFKKLTEYQFHLQIQKDLADDIIRQYGWNIPESVGYYFSHNREFWQRVMYEKISRENRLLDAKNRILQVQQDMYRDDDLSGVFDTCMSQKPVSIQSAVDKDKRISQLRYDIKQLDEQLMSMSSIEAKWVEREERDRLVKELQTLI